MDRKLTVLSLSSSTGADNDGYGDGLDINDKLLDDGCAESRLNGSEWKKERERERERVS